MTRTWVALYRKSLSKITGGLQSMGAKDSDTTRQLNNKEILQAYEKRAEGTQSMQKSV